MKKSSLLCPALLLAFAVSAQPSFQTSLQAGISLPLNSNSVNASHAGEAIHFGNHLDYTFGSNSVRFGLGAYVGFINSIATDNKYKQIGASIAEKYRLSAAQLTFNDAAFKSTHILLGPVASFGTDKYSISVWAKGGYGLNEPSRYAVMYKEGNIVNNIYVNQAGEHKNGLAYNMGTGLRFALSEYVGLQLSAAYFGTKTDQVNYNFDRDKGTTAAYTTAANQFIQASAGLQFTIGNPGKKNSATRRFSSDTGGPSVSRMDQKIKTKSNIKNDRVINSGGDNPVAARMYQKIKTKSNIKNDRLMNPAGNDADNETGSDSLFFSPEKIELLAAVPGNSGIQMQSVDNFLTGFVYQTPAGAVISQCGSNAMPGDPIPGLDVKFKRLGSGGNDILSTRTNKDGSFAFNSIAPGQYSATAGTDAMDITVRGNNENAFKTLDIAGGSCGNSKENFVISAGDKTYVEVTTAREAGSGMATGKKHIGNVKYEDIKVVMAREAGSGMATGRRMHKPYPVTDMEFDINQDKVFTSDGKLYAEVITAREAGSGMATGRRTLVTGDVDGDGLSDNAVVTTREAGSGMATGRRMHKPITITKDWGARQAAGEIVSPHDAQAGLPTGKRMHKPYTITKELDITEVETEEIVSSRDAQSGLPTGRRQYQPIIIRIDEEGEAYQVKSAREAGSGMATGRRQYQPIVISIDPETDEYETVSPRDAQSGLPTGRRQYQPLLIRKYISTNDDGGEIVEYHIVHRDLAARNGLAGDETGTQKMAIKEQGMPAKKGDKKQQVIIINEDDNDSDAARDAGSGLATGRRKSPSQSYEPWDTGDSDEGIVSNPLYESTGNSGENPMFEGKSALNVAGSNGTAHALFLPSAILIQNTNQAALEAGTVYQVGPIKWMAPESLNNRKGINQSGIKRNEDAARKGWDGTVKGGSKGINQAGVTDKGIQENGLTEKGITQSGIKRNEDAARKGWDGSVKGSGKGINEAGLAAKGVNHWGDRGDEAMARKGWDGTVKGGAMVKEISRVHCADGTCSVDAIVEVDGVTYEAVISGVLKTKHDTAKNSVGNIR